MIIYNSSNDFEQVQQQEHDRFLYYLLKSTHTSSTYMHKTTTLLMDRA